MALLPALLHLGLFYVANNLAPKAMLSTELWNASLGTQPLIVFVFECLLFGLSFWALSRLVQSGKKEIEIA